jgi:hypothetical protein
MGARRIAQPAAVSQRCTFIAVLGHLNMMWRSMPKGRTDIPLSLDLNEI